MLLLLLDEDSFLVGATVEPRRDLVTCSTEPPWDDPPPVVPGTGLLPCPVPG